MLWDTIQKFAGNIKRKMGLKNRILNLRIGKAPVIWERKLRWGDVRIKQIPTIMDWIMFWIMPPIIYFGVKRLILKQLCQKRNEAKKSGEEKNVL